MSYPGIKVEDCGSVDQDAAVAAFITAGRGGLPISRLCSLSPSSRRN